MKDKAIFLVYDKQCPLCDNYCKLVRIKETVGDLVLIDARTNSEVMQEITQSGLDIDQGMVLKMADILYYGSDAIHALSLISSRSGIFNRFNYWLFRSKRLSSISYPVLRSMRNILLRILSKTKINNLGYKDNRYF